MLSTAREVTHAQNQVYNTNVLLENKNNPKNINFVESNRSNNLNSAKENETIEDTDLLQMQANRNHND